MVQERGGLAYPGQPAAPPARTPRRAARQPGSRSRVRGADGPRSGNAACSASAPVVPYSTRSEHTSVWVGKPIWRDWLTIELC